MFVDHTRRNAKFLRESERRDVVGFDEVFFKRVSTKSDEAGRSSRNLTVAEMLQFGCTKTSWPRLTSSGIGKLVYGGQGERSLLREVWQFCLLPYYRPKRLGVLFGVGALIGLGVVPNERPLGVWDDDEARRDEVNRGVLPSLVSAVLKSGVCD